METTLDLRGLSCPIPLIQTRDALANNVSLKKLIVLVDELPARDNIIKFAKSQNYQVDCSTVIKEYTISISR